MKKRILFTLLGLVLTQSAYAGKSFFRTFTTLAPGEPRSAVLKRVKGLKEISTFQEGICTVVELKDGNVVLRDKSTKKLNSDLSYCFEEELLCGAGFLIEGNFDEFKKKLIAELGAPSKTKEGIRYWFNENEIILTGRKKEQTVLVLGTSHHPTYKKILLKTGQREIQDILDAKITLSASESREYTYNPLIDPPEKKECFIWPGKLIQKKDDLYTTYTPRGKEGHAPHGFAFTIKKSFTRLQFNRPYWVVGCYTRNVQQWVETEKRWLAVLDDAYVFQLQQHR